MGYGPGVGCGAHRHLRHRHPAFQEVRVLCWVILLVIVCSLAVVEVVIIGFF